MSAVTLEFVTRQLELGEQLRAGQGTMFEPQDLPGRYGRVVNAIDRILQVTGCPAVLGGGWAVWRHGFFGRLTQDIDIVLPADRIDEFLRAASVAGFELLTTPAGRWPKVRHKDTDVTVDILPEGATPGTTEHPAPTTIPHPQVLGAVGSRLSYISLAGLVELKLAAGRIRDDYDIVELLRTNATQVDVLKCHVASIHADYAVRFNELARRAAQQEDH